MIPAHFLGSLLGIALFKVVFPLDILFPSSMVSCFFYLNETHVYIVPPYVYSVPYTGAGSDVAHCTYCTGVGRSDTASASCVSLHLKCHHLAGTDRSQSSEFEATIDPHLPDHVPAM